MKKILIFTFMIFSVYLNASERLFYIADSLYVSNNYKQSIETYNKILNKGLESSELYYNLALCYFKTEKFQESKSYFQKSLILNPNSEDAKHKIIICNSKLNIKKKPKLFYKIWNDKAISFFSIFTWSFLSLLFILTSILIVIYKLIRKYKNNYTLLIPLILFSLVFYFFTVNLSNKQQEIFKSQTTKIIKE